MWIIATGISQKVSSFEAISKLKYQTVNNDLLDIVKLINKSKKKNIDNYRVSCSFVTDINHGGYYTFDFEGWILITFEIDDYNVFYSDLIATILTDSNKNNRNVAGYLLETAKIVNENYLKQKRRRII